MPVGEVVLGAFLQVLFDRLMSLELLQFASQKGIQSKLKKWEKTLRIIDDLLIDAEKKQVKEPVKRWLDDLQDLAYDVEDILDEFATEALRCQLTVEDRVSTCKVRNLMPSCLTACTPSALKLNISIGNKIDAITRRLEELYKQRIGLGLEKIDGGTTSTAASKRPDYSTSVPRELAVYGRDDDKAKILEMVLCNQPSDVNFVVIAIVGMGGLGKTTLARNVYNDTAVEDFSPRGWVCVSDHFDVFRISKALLESITQNSCCLNDLEPVQVKLKNEVAGKKFLLVLDDVWSEDYGLWESLRSPFLAGAPGSKIILTTRNREVALTMGQSDYCYDLNLLTEEACWDIFKTHVSGSRILAESQNLKLYREKVVKRCGGLPLAARTLGGLLRTKQTDDEWENVLNSNIWDSSYSSNILPVLELSYRHLPSPLKRCFAYCAIFSKDYEFAEMDLVLLWMAEGLIQQSTSKQLEDVGREYFCDLLSRSIFQRSNGDVSKFVMHDLVNDLARSISRYTSFNLDDKLSLPLQNFKRIRHTAYTPGSHEIKNKLEIFYEAENLRTFLPLGLIQTLNLSFVNSAILSDLLLKLKN